MSTRLKKLRRVFVWELPVRVYHWINAGSIVILCITGYLIGDPPNVHSGEEASYRYLFGTIRFIHFVAAYVFLFNFIIRLYWGFVGNKYARWYNFIPTTKKYFRDMWQVLKVDIFLTKGTENLHVGHNPMAGFTYFMMFLAFAMQIVTGFGLYASMSNWWLPNLFKWVVGIFGSDFALRNWHHATMWFFIIFTMIHVYLVFYHDYVEGRGEISSMGGGWKFVEEHVFEKDQQEEANKVS